MKNNNQSSAQLKLTINEHKKESFLDTAFRALKMKRASGWPDVFGKKIHAHNSITKKRPIYTLSLFTGCGGLDIGFHDVGFDIVEMVEIEEKFVQTLVQNTGKGKYLDKARPICIDIRKYDPTFKHNIDFIIGGPPCQTFSAAGRRAAGVLGTTDSRGVLFQEYVRLLKKLQPKAFLFENVYGIIGAEGGKPWELIQKSFKEAGYTLHYRILDVADYGVPQHRERLIIVGIRAGEKNFLFPQPIVGPDSEGEENYYTAEEAVDNAKIEKTQKSELTGRYGHLLKEIPNGLNYSFYTKKMGHPNPVFGWRSKFSDFLYKADPKKPVRSIKAQGGKYTGPFSWENRAFEIPEFKRLQTIPDEYELVGGRSKSIHQIGNSVPPQFARMLALSIIDQVFEISPPFKMRYLSANTKLNFRKRKHSQTKEYRQKAQDGINDIGIKNTIDKNYRDDGELMFSLMRNLRFHSIKNGHKMKDTICSEKISFSLSNEKWVFGYSNSKNQKIIELFIKPSSNKPWTLPTKEVVFLLNEADEFKLTLLWKFFEKKLCEVSGYADLVQLSGYYQYKSQIKIESFAHETSHTKSDLWKVLNNILSGNLTAKEMHISEYAALLAINISTIKEVFLRLKSAGYEIRNHNTNPQIKPECYLIPYSFPTLTPNSVQLHKNL